MIEPMKVPCEGDQPVGLVFPSMTAFPADDCIY
jgi:hypothetical protein